MAAAPPAAPRQTWQAWLPPGAAEPQVLSRDAVLAQLRARGIDVPVRTLEHWQRVGVLPYPVRRWHEGSVKAVFPWWVVEAVVHLRQLQARGLSLSKIAPHMRAWALSEITWQDPLAGPLAEMRAAATAYARAYEQVTGVPIGGVRIELNDGRGGSIDHIELPVPPGV